MANSPDTAEFLRLLLAAQPRIYAYCRAQFMNSADADDVYQETVMTLWSKFGEFAPGTDFVAWAYAIARYKVLHHRRKKAEKTGFSEAFMELVADELERGSDEVDTLQEALAACLKKLPPADRRVVQHYYGSDGTLAQLASRMQRPLDTLKSVLRRSRGNLYRCIQRTLRQEGRA